MPAGDSMLVTAMGGCGRWYGRSCRTASVSENQSPSTLNGSVSVRSRTTTSRASAMRGRSRLGSMPSIRASVR